MYKRILVPIDGSATASKALTTALQMASESGGQIAVVHDLDDLSFAVNVQYAGVMMQAAREEADRVLADALGAARAAGVPAETRLVGGPGRRLGETVAEEATRWGADLIVVGTHGRRGISRAILGSGAEQVIRLAPVPVLVVRNPDEPAAR